MPASTELSRLREVVRDEIAITLRAGGDHARGIARRVCAQNHPLIVALGDRLAEDAVTRLVNREVKRWGAVGTSMREQLVLPSMLEHLITDLPAAISVPSDDDEPIYRPLFGAKCATVCELRAAVATLWKSIADDQRKAKALTQVLDLLTSLGADDDVAVSAALERAMARAA